MTSIYDVLKASKGIHVDDTFAELWGRKLSNAYTVETYIGTLPATLQTVEGYLESYKIYGNTEQNGTPTPENPIMPSGCGERTENLFSGEFSQFNNVGGTGNTYVYFYIPEDFTLTLIAKDTHTIPANIFLGITKDGGQATGGFTWDISQRQNVAEGDKFTVKSSINGYHYVSMYQKTASTLNWILEHYYVMLNLGSTALPYEPYGYKLPILSNSTVTNIYLGEVETTRRIKKLVLTGEETWSYLQSNAPFKLNLMDGVRRPSPTSIYWTCSHYEAVSNSASWAPYDSCISWSTADRSSGLRFRDIRYSNLDDFKSYLAAQYAAGTPVTVWYVLAEPETGIVNEPLMKIGDYADTVSMEQAGVSIPTAPGETTISWAGEGLAPSEVELTYRKRKGQ